MKKVMLEQIMKSKLILCLALVLSGILPSVYQVQSADATNPTRVRLERMAETYGHFSLTAVIHNRALRLWPPMEEIMAATNSLGIWKRGTNALAAEPLHLVGELRELSGNRDALAELLKLPSPKVRTLALGAIFQREDGRDLPLIASLINDPAPTFSNLHESVNSMGGPRPVSEVENQQSVGDVAQAMLAFWGVSHEGQPVGMEFGRPATSITTDDFAEYWKKYAGRQYAASWFMVKMKRATRQTTPIQPEYKPDIQRVLAEMKALPMPDRKWTQLYVLAPEGWFEFEKDNFVATDGELIAMIKKISPESLLHFLQRKNVSDDPDLLMDKDNQEFVRMSNFILRHADQLLRPEDADALLACEYTEHDSGGVNPAWAIGAALVQPARAGEILHDALAHETRSYETAAGTLAGALWQIRGPAEMDFLVNWFYNVLPTASEPMHQPVAFLWGVQAAARPDTKQLIAALVKDSRFDYTDWDTLTELLKIVNASRSTPLVKERDIYDAQPNGLLDDRIVLASWRNLLRRKYRLPEKPLPLSEAKPNQVLTQPAWSVTLAIPAAQVVVSPDGKSLALLTNGMIAIWKADTGELWWQIPNPAWAGSYAMAFQTNGQLTLMEHDQYGLFSEWDLATHKKIRQVPLTGKPDSGVDERAYAFDRAASRFGFSGYNDVICFDARNGQAIWRDQHEGGVRSVVALSSDGTLLAAGGGYESQRVVKVFDATNGKLLRQIDEHSGKVEALTFSTDGHSLATITAADGVQVWDVATGKLLRKYSYPVKFMGAGMPACMPAFSLDGRWLAIAGAWTDSCHFRIGIFRVETGELQWEIRHKESALDGPPFALTLAPDGQTLYSCGDRLEAWPLK
jgi:WD40 repeat protein